MSMPIPVHHTREGSGTQRIRDTGKARVCAVGVQGLSDSKARGLLVQGSSDTAWAHTA